MLSRKLQIRVLPRLLAVLFAMQVGVGGFCLLTADAHAAQAQGVQDIEAHCAKSVQAGLQAEHDADQHTHSGNCYHCDQPDELSNSAYPTIAPLALALVDLITLPAVPHYDAAANGSLTTRTPTGPPGSAALLYTTTQRIRI